MTGYWQKLEKTYYAQGFFNIPAQYDSLVRREEGPIQILLSDGTAIEGKIIRKATRNGTARILGGSALRDFFQRHFSLFDTFWVDLSSPEAIRLTLPSHHRPNTETTTMELHPAIVEALLETHEKLSKSGLLLSEQNLADCYQRFREKFGPEKLLSLDGEALLDYVHNHSNKDSLVYWLEFKDDPEFPAAFGSIAGGSALKFGIYRRRETGRWMTGHPTEQIELTVEEAIGYARKHRDQLVNGDKLLSQMPETTTYEEYVKLQESLNKEAPDVSNLAWGHKYFHLLHPNLLDDYHSPAYQRHMLIKMLQMPPKQEGRYLAAFYFLKIARHFHMPITHLTSCLNELYGAPYSYWRIGTKDGGDDIDYWPEMKAGNFVSVGWPKLGDLSWLTFSAEDKEKLKAMMAKHHPRSPSIITNFSNQLLKFVRTIKENDLVIAADGVKVLGIGQVTGDYQYDPSSGFPHKRPVKWLSLEQWKEIKQEGLRRVVHQLSKNPENLLEIEKRILGVPAPPPPLLKKIEGIPGQIQSVLERKKQVILYGPPGTGKTYWAEVACLELAALSWYGKRYADLTEEQQHHVKPGPGEIKPFRLCCFHPAYGYEDFLEGFRPELQDKQMSFVRKQGIFKQLCQEALGHPDKNFYLLIDEINRGDIPRIFGELLTIIEKDKRGKSVVLPLSGESFSIPDNVYVIGTMNTADRSIALLDTALRRRFGFVELMPDPSVLGDAMIEGLPLGPWLEALNRRICAHVGRDARNLQIGHSYLLEGGKPLQSFSSLSRVLREDLIPLLEEYCYEDYGALGSILGKGLVDIEGQKIRTEMFNPNKKADLIRVLLEIDPDIVASLATVIAEQEAFLAEESLDDDDESNDAPEAP